MSVPCGDCTACCKSSLFVHIKPDETKTIEQIPKELLFPVPGLPHGHVLMGYDELGKCPMFQNNQCSIYEFRPRTCREFDCRIFAATGVEMNNDAQAMIVERARRWVFEYPADSDRSDHSALRATVSFLRDHKSLFPAQFVPANPTQFALLAIKVFRVFEEKNETSDNTDRPRSDAQIVSRVLEAVANFATV